jgi:hypothetical protein
MIEDINRRVDQIEGSISKFKDRLFENIHLEKKNKE